jgi:hypothetical protein
MPFQLGFRRNGSDRATRMRHDLTSDRVRAYSHRDGSPFGDQKGTQCERNIALCCGCPRNCKRRVFCHMSTGISGPGKAMEGNDPRARRPAVSRGHTRALSVGVYWRQANQSSFVGCAGHQVRGDVPQSVLPEVSRCSPICLPIGAAIAASCVLLRSSRFPLLPTSPRWRKMRLRRHHLLHRLRPKRRFQLQLKRHHQPPLKLRHQARPKQRRPPQRLLRRSPNRR